MSYEYRMTVSFRSDRELTPQEIRDLETTVWAQILEPQTDTDDPMGWTDAEYDTSSITLNTEMVYAAKPVTGDPR